MRAKQLIAVLLGLPSALALPRTFAQPHEISDSSATLSHTGDGFEAAENAAREKLKDSTLPADVRADTTMELVRTLTAHARAERGEKRERCFQEAAKIVAEFAARYPRDSRLLLVQVQGALACSVQAQLKWQTESMAVPPAAQPPGLERAVATAREAVKAWRTVREDIAAARRAPPSARGVAGKLTTRELAALDNQAALQLALSHTNQAECFSVGEADQIAALGDALALAENLKGLPVEDPVGWPARALHVQLLRRSGKPAAAERILSQYASENPPLSVAQDLEAERIRSALDLGHTAQASSIAVAAARGDEPLSPRLQQASLEAFLARWREASGSPQPADTIAWRERIANQLDQIESLGDAFSLAQAARSIRRAARLPSAEGFDDLMERAARAAYLSGMPDEAVEYYDAAAAAAGNRPQADRAFELALAAGLIEHACGRSRSAADRLADAALAHASHPRAAEAHRLALANFSKTVAGGGPEKLAAYRQMLEDHLERWPQAATIGQVQFWLGRVAAEQRDWPAAAKAWRAVAPDDPQFTSAVLGAAQVLQERLPGGAAAAEQLLASALQQQVRAQEGASDWPHSGNVALAVALAAQKKFSQAEQIAGELPIDPPCHRFRLADRLGRIRGVEEDRARVRQLRQAALEPLELHRQELSGASRELLEQLRAAAAAP